MTVLEALRAARNLIADQSKWTTGQSARNASGQPVIANDPGAVCWCSIGALSHVVVHNSQLFHLATDELERVAHDISGGYSIVHVNDYLGHDAALNMFDRAIAQLDQPEVFACPR